MAKKTVFQYSKLMSVLSEKNAYDYFKKYFFTFYKV